MSSSRLWLFRGLVIVAAGLMVTSWILPWWSASLSVLAGVKDAVIIHPYGLEQHLGGLASFLPADGVEMPVWFAPLMWIYLGVCVVALLYTSWIGEKEGKWGKLKFKWAKLLIGGVGLSYIIVAVIAVIFAAIRTGQLGGMSLLGYSFVKMGGETMTGVDATLRFGYFMAHGVGLLCIALALLRDKIIGKPKLNV